MSQRKMPVKTADLKLDGEWEGWNFTARTNAPISVFSDIASQDFERIVKGLSRVVLKWNFVNEEGTPYGNPTRENIADLPLDLVTSIANAFVEELTKVPPA